MTGRLSLGCRTSDGHAEFDVRIMHEERGPPAVRSLESELAQAKDLDVEALADAIETIGFECTRCGACCKAGSSEAPGGPEQDRSSDVADSREEHVATVFPDEIRRLRETTEYDWRDVARPMPYGLARGNETFEWALQTDACGDCTFYTEADDGTGSCTVHSDRPLICRTYPFSVALGGTSQPMGEQVDAEGMLRAHECEGLGREISRSDAEDLARTLKRRAVRELEEAIAVRDTYEPHPDSGGIVIHDSEGARRPDGTFLDGADEPS